MAHDDQRQALHPRLPGNEISATVMMFSDHSEATFGLQQLKILCRIPHPPFKSGVLADP